MNGYSPWGGAGHETWSSTTYVTQTVKLLSVGGAFVNPTAVQAVDADRNGSGKARLYMARGHYISVSVDVAEVLRIIGEDAELLTVGEGAVNFAAIEAITPAPNSSQECRVHLVSGASFELSVSVGQAGKAISDGLAARKAAKEKPTH